MIDNIQRMMVVSSLLVLCAGGILLAGRKWIDWFALQLRHLLTFHSVRTEKAARSFTRRRARLADVVARKTSLWTLSYSEYSYAGMRVRSKQFAYWANAERARRGLASKRFLDSEGFLIAEEVAAFGAEHDKWVADLLKGEAKDFTGWGIRCLLIGTALGVIGAIIPVGWMAPEAPSGYGHASKSAATAPASGGADVVPP